MHKQRIAAALAVGMLAFGGLAVPVAGAADPGPDPNESGVTETADLDEGTEVADPDDAVDSSEEAAENAGGESEEAAEGSDTEVTDPEAAEGTDTEVADPEAAEGTDTEVTDTEVDTDSEAVDPEVAETADPEAADDTEVEATEVESPDSDDCEDDEDDCDESTNALVTSAAVSDSAISAQPNFTG